ncbi:MAG: hypothetical protein LBK18_09520 [Prevotellaceae bacterium]|jgi:hypothetical protein|nr:hypothetical protein [Prevotellaceae bacterium]
MNYKGRELTEGEFTVAYRGNTEIRRVTRVPRNFCLKFRGDLYSHAIMVSAEKLKTYSDRPNDNAELLKDKYGRKWLHVFYRDVFNDRIEEIFDFVEDEAEADQRYQKTGGGPRYLGNLPHFFASENYDFILHEEADEKGDVEKEKLEILKLNKEIFEVSAVEKKYYELWGEDNFAGDSFLIKVYENKDEAEVRLKELEESVLNQDERLRDAFWIRETSAEKIKERERIEEERIERLNKKWHYDDDRLRNYVILLVERLMEVIALNKRRLIKKQRILLQENNSFEEDCYSYIALEYFKRKSNNSVGTMIKFRDGGSSSTTAVIKEPHEIAPSESLYTLLIEKFATDIQEAKYDYR